MRPGPWKLTVLAATLAGLVLTVTLLAGYDNNDAKSTKEEPVWVLHDQTWDFKDLMKTFKPVGGRYAEGEVTWVFEFTRDLEAAEAGALRGLTGGPLKLTFYDEDKTPVKTKYTGKLTGDVTAKKGDRFKVVIKLPDAGALKQIKRIVAEKSSKAFER